MILLADSSTVTFLAKGTLLLTWAHGQGTLQLGTTSDDGSPEVPIRALVLFVLFSWWGAGILKLVRTIAFFHLLLFISHGVCS